MRVALCISGFLRTAREAYPSTAQNITMLNNCDVFVSTWNIWGHSHYKHGEAPRLKEEPLLPGQVEEIFGSPLKDFRIEQYDQTTRLIRNKVATSANVQPGIHYDISCRLASMHYQINKCDSLRKRYEKEHDVKYDVIIRCRPDLNFLHPIYLQTYNVVDDSTIFVPMINNYGYINDQFAFGGDKAMSWYASIFDNFFTYSKHVAVYVAENLMEYHLKSGNLNIKQKGINYDIVRGGNKNLKRLKINRIKIL